MSGIIELDALAADVDGIGAAIERKNPDFSATQPTDTWEAAIDNIPTGGTPAPSDGWVRPFDRPAPPVIGEDEQVIYELFGVGQYSPNDNAFRMTTSTGQYRVDWGDGTVEDYNSGTTAEHIYDYDSLAVPVGSEGYKWVWVKVTPLTGNLTIVNFHQFKHSLRPSTSSHIFIPQVFEVYMRGSEITNLVNSASHYTQLRLCEIFHFYGTHKISALDYFCMNYTNLRRMVADITNASAYFMVNCQSYDEEFSAGVTFSKVTTNFMAGDINYNRRFPDGVTFENATALFMQDCRNYNKAFPNSVIFGKVTTQFMNQCNVFGQPLVVTLQNTTAIGTSFIGTACFALRSLRLLNMGAVHTALMISNSSLDVPALVALFGDLYDRSETTSGTITITNVYGASRLTAEQRAIATSRNWLVVG